MTIAGPLAVGWRARESTAWAAAPNGATASSAPGFSDARRRTFGALVAAYDGVGKDTPIRAGKRDVVTAFRDRYQGGTQGFRELADATLDAIEVAPDSGPFSTLPLSEARRTLGEWGSRREPSDELMFVPRPADASEPDDLKESSDRAGRAISEFMATLPPGAMELDETTGLPRYQPPVPRRRPITEGGPLDTEVRVKRHLRSTAYQLLIPLFVADARPYVDRTPFG